jgi:signal transduction histidine kinase
VTTSALVAAALYALPALVWAVIARRQSWYVRLRRPRSRGLRMLPLVGWAVAAHYGLQLALTLAPLGLHDDPSRAVESPIALVWEVSWLVVIALLRHLVRLLPIPERRPSAGWLAGNYGLAAAAASADAWMRLPLDASAAQQLAAHRLFEVSSAVMIGLLMIDVWRSARPGVWGPEYAGEIRRPDVLVGAAGAAMAAVVMPLLVEVDARGLGHVLYESVTGLAIATPFALRMLPVLVTQVAMTLGLLGAAAAVLVTRSALISHAGSAWRPLLDVMSILALAAVFVPGRRWLRAAIDRLVLRRSGSEQPALLTFLHTLSPEAGIRECCRLALAELVRIRRIPGAAILLGEEEPIVHGAFDVAPLLAAWPRGASADVLAPRSFGSVEIRELPVGMREALTRAGVGLGTFAIRSPRRSWGHLFLRTGLLQGAFDEPDLQALNGFSDQLALLLDAADLLTRAVAVERSLAHAEKLAAIGETAARIAHDIRNPVTAARSLTQQLAREPTAPFHDELEVILEELDRVERQVAHLLHFARREEPHLEAVNLCALVETTLAQLRPRLATAGVEVALHLESGIEARGDRERLRQVLVNLVENAAEALDGSPRRELSVQVAAANGTARLRVSDTGPGVPEDAMARLFEPFFSLKANGTGLGLAIAKRTLEAHGGRITAAIRPQGGMTFEVDLPLAGAHAE